MRGAFLRPALLEERAAATLAAEAAEVMAARWQGRSVSASPAVQALGVPDGDAWQACRGRLATPGCAAARAAALRWLPADGRQGWALVEALGAPTFLRERTGPLPVVLAWGAPPPGSRAAAAVHREALATLLGPVAESEDGRASPRSVAATAALLGVAPPEDEVVAAVAELRAGGTPAAAHWTEPGLAGLLALEAGAEGRADLLAEVLDVAAEGPTAADRIAGLSAGLRLAPVEAWPAGHPAVARGRALAAQSAPGAELPAASEKTE